MRLPSVLRFRKPEIALVTFAAVLSWASTGCLSNEYVIPRAELSRLTQLPPEQRGQSVHVVQEIGSRRGEAIDVNAPAAPAGYAEGAGAAGYPPGAPPPEGYVEGGGEPGVGIGVLIIPGPGGPPMGHGFAGGPGPRMPGPGGAVAGGPMGRAPRAAAPAPSGKSTGSKLGKGGGGGKDDLAVFLIVLAVVATVGMVATEGARYDGTIAMYPWQGVHLKGEGGQERVVPLAQLTPADAASAREAVVMDDEGWGVMRLGRRPLDRKGFAFKLNVGGFHSSSSALEADSAAFGLQVGYFPHSMVGILGSWSIAGGNDAASKSFYRNSLALEAQVFPISLWRLHLGAFGHAGMQYADDALGGTRDGQAFGGGVMLELALTTRLALSFRADYTSAKIGANGGWQGGELFTAGLSIY